MDEQTGGAGVFLAALGLFVVGIMVVLVLLFGSGRTL
jgi:hypothetical protein